jgi:fermentation-respiration switch protein FrsA (DUF1100 family)
MSDSPQRELHFESGDATLVGTLHVPGGDGPYPALVMLQGSGDSDRDSNGYFPPIREHFLRRGLAVFSFDKPGCGASSGDWRRRALRDRAQLEIDARAVGLWGQSQGGWTVPLAAMLAPEIPFIIPQSCPSLTPDEQALYDAEQQLRGASLIERALAQAGNRDVTIRIFPGATHRIQDAVSGEFPPGYLACMTDWLRERIERARGESRPHRDARPPQPRAANLR